MNSEPETPVLRTTVLKTAVPETPVLDINNLYLSFKTLTGKVDVLHGIDLRIRQAEKVALVGESGSGKSVTARIVLGLLQETRNARVTGDVLFAGDNINTMKPACLLYTSPSPRDATLSRMPSSA